jgi:hypothetical protein
MTDGLPPVKTEAEARALMAAGLGRAELEFATSLTAPLYWIIRDDERRYRVRNGSAFFLDAGNGPFGVTACHVVEGWRQDRANGNVVGLQLGLDLPIDFEGSNALIAAHEGIDIATFRVSADEIKRIGKTALTGFQTNWPPRPPQQGRGIYYAGFPGVETIWLSATEISFGAAPGGGIASSVSETDVSSLIEREHLIAVLGHGPPPEDYNFGGMSGGPMLSVIETKALRSWALAGVIYQGPNPSPDAAHSIAGLQIMKARRADFILPDGTLNVRLWNELSVGRGP